MACTMCRPLSLLGLFLILTPLLCGCTGGGFSVELIHRDSPRSPFHDPSLTPRARVLAAVRRSYAGSGSPGPDGAVSEVISGTFQFFMYMSAATSLPRRFSYCLTPYLSDVSSALNFGSRATVTEPGAVTTPMVHSPVHVEAFYTVEIVALRIGSSIIKLPKRSPVIVDSGSLLTSLDKELLDPVVEAVTGSIKLPRKPPPSPNPEMFSVCYEADGMKALEKVFPDVTLELGGGALLTLKAENLFVDLLLRTVCLAVVPVTYEGSVPTIGSILQQNMHVGYDLDKRTITFAPADCATSYPSPPASSV
ncbi:unnamed protein product [Triticum turgidum subsp. durum]|uniref:Peptidase A1 domain-containing protein n=1 Tax=Triticum turgidum subsp. durum TaxID=4567 RepID=A0A9R0TEU1_TRITD|nr:unnamed protein product [Triticum turgidum subsp. durum]